MQNCTFLLLFRPIFGEKSKTAPPKEIGCGSREVGVVIRCEKVFECVILAEKLDSISAKTFFFLRPPDFGLKNRMNFRIWPKNQTQFRRRPFFLGGGGEKLFEFPILAEKSTQFRRRLFFLETTCFWAEKTFELSAFREISSQFSDKPCETDSRTMKIRVKVVCTFLTLSKTPSPFQILATRLV